MSDSPRPYRGRLAPSPTGLLHLGHARTFWIARERAAQHGGELILRIEDLDRDRCRLEFEAAIVEDLRWFGIHWAEGPFRQSERRAIHLAAWQRLCAGGHLYPCHCSRRDIEQSLSAPHRGEDEPLYPGTCRPDSRLVPEASSPAGVSWRFRVPHGEKIRFRDERLGEQEGVAGIDFGDFVVWRRDDIPAYQLAVVVDDIAMRITEVVRGEDLLTSTFRQLLLYRALGSAPPAFYHAPLITDSSGERLAKRNAALTLRTLRERGLDSAALRDWNPGDPL